jgi:hypothetical protein
MTSSKYYNLRVIFFTFNLDTISFYVNLFSLKSRNCVHDGLFRNAWLQGWGEDIPQYSQRSIQHLPLNAQHHRQPLTQKSLLREFHFSNNGAAGLHDSN